MPYFIRLPYSIDIYFQNSTAFEKDISDFLLQEERTLQIIE